MSCMVTASCLSLKRLEIFSDKTTPDMSMRVAARATSSMPGVFRPALIGRDLYVDGGVMCYNPVHLIGLHYPLYANSVLSLVYADSDGPGRANVWGADPARNVYALFCLALERIRQLGEQVATTRPARVLHLPVGHVGTLDVLPSREDLSALCARGARYARTAFKDVGIVLEIPGLQST